MDKYQNEIKKLIELIEKKTNYKINSYWNPTEGMLIKHCLFIQIEDQDRLMKENEDLEVEIYRAVKNDLKNFEYFDMVALL